ncbi:hypothetical protein CHELA1G2_10706 [Hyphomicrobiales bacterium]|nr:hypothetical protein CHELA1G2_10706 [Hyphomicrobiales bacterium]
MSRARNCRTSSWIQAVPGSWRKHGLPRADAAFANVSHIVQSIAMSDIMTFNVLPGAPDILDIIER